MLVIYYIIYVLSVIFVAAGCGDNPAETDQAIDVGIYGGAGAWSVSVTAIQAAVNDAGYSTEIFDETAVFEDHLNRYLIVVLPGGDPREYIITFGSIGRTNLRRFVTYGGGLIGLGGGAAVTDNDVGQNEGIGLFRGDARWPLERIAPYPNYTLTDITLVDPTHQVGRGGGDRYWTLYRWGPDFTADNPASINVIYNYELTDTPAVIAFDYEAGRVFLSGCQLEIEENDDRDSTEFSIELNDPESEWDIISRALAYCLERQ